MRGAAYCSSATGTVVRVVGPLLARWAGGEPPPANVFADAALLVGYQLYGAAPPRNSGDDRLALLQALPASTRLLFVSGEKDEFPRPRRAADGASNQIGLPPLPNPRPPRHRVRRQLDGVGQQRAVFAKGLSIEARRRRDVGEARRRRGAARGGGGSVPCAAHATVVGIENTGQLPLAQDESEQSQRARSCCGRRPVRRRAGRRRRRRPAEARARPRRRARARRRRRGGRRLHARPRREAVAEGEKRGAYGRTRFWV